MAKGRIEQEIALKVTGLDDVKDIDKKIEALTKKKAKIEVDADATDASKKIDKIDTQIDALSKRKAELQVTADTAAAERSIQDVIDKVDKLGHGDAANLLITTNATRVGGEIADLVIKLDTLDDPVEIRATIDNIGKLEGDLDQLQAKAKAINDTPIEIDTSRATGGIDNIGKSADSSRSVLANMVGNSTQDLGQLGGIAGSTGVAIGQMGEYMADAASNGDKFGQIIKGFGSIAVPLAAVAIATQAISGHFEKMAQDEKFADEQMRRFSKSIQEGADTAAVLREELESTGKLEFKVQISGPDIDVGDITGPLAAAGLKIEDFIALSKLSNEEFRRWADNAEAAGVSTHDLAAISLGLAGYQQQVATATSNAANNNEILGKTYVTEREAILAATLAQKARVDELNKIDEAKRAHDSAAAYSEFADGMHEAAVAAEEMGKEVADASESLLDGEHASEAFATALTKINAASELDFSQMAQDTGDSFDTLKGAIEGAQKAADGWSEVDLTPESVDELKGIPDELQAVTDGISGMRDSIQTELQAAFDTGGIQAYRDKATFFAGEIKDQFVESFRAAGAGEDEANRKADELLGALGLLPEQVEIQVKLTREEEARQALEAFSSIIDGMPESVQVAINAAIAQGDIEGALTLLNDQLINRGYPPIVLPVDADAAEAQAAVDLWTTNANAAAAEGSFDADPSEADLAVDVWTAATNRNAAQTAFDADPTNADRAVDLWTATTNLTTAQAKLDANRAPADAAVDGWERAANATRATATVTAQAQTGQADRDLDNVASQQRTAIINAAVKFFTFAEGGTVGPAGGIAGEAGEEFITLPDGRTVLLRGATPVPPGTRVTSTRRTRSILARSAAAPRALSASPSGGFGAPISLPKMTVNVNAAVIGSRYAVAKAVGQGTRDLRRLIGSRGTSA